MALNSRQAQKAATRAAILRTAAEQFDANGYAATTVGEIADRLGMTKGSVYFHFPSKAELAAEVAGEYFHLWEPVLSRVDEQGLTGLDALIWASREVALRYRDDVTVRAAVRLMRESSIIDASMPVPFVGWIEVVRRYLEQARESGGLRPGVDIDALAWHLVAQFFGTQEVSHQLSERGDLAERIDLLWTFTLDGVRGEAGPGVSVGSAPDRGAERGD